MSTWRPRYYDIGVNFSDSMFQGYYNGSATPKHAGDLDKVIERAKLFNVRKMLVTASSIQESQDHLDLCQRYPGLLKSTVGVHPCSVATEFCRKDDDGQYTDTLVDNIDEKLKKLKDLVVAGFTSGHVGAFGEIGLDYDRLHYASKNQQQALFKRQLDVIASVKHLKVPLFLHMRNACEDFVGIIKPYLDRGDIFTGVVHSFTGTEKELSMLLELGFYIGVNGCSLKTDDNLKVVAKIPRTKLMIETDAPWCEIRKSHASYNYITPYPSKFYPKLENEDLIVKSKLDPNLPFASVKKEAYNKHIESVESDTAAGILAVPMVKSRNEPVNVGFVAEIMAHLYGLNDANEIQDFVDEVYDTTIKVFG